MGVCQTRLHVRRDRSADAPDDVDDRALDVLHDRERDRRRELGGSAVGIACWVAFDAALATASIIGAVSALLSIAALFRWSARLGTGVASDVLFASPSP
jgi:hypothetical protein